MQQPHPPPLEVVRAWVGDLRRVTATDDRERIELLRALEELANAAAAAQARVTRDLVNSQRAEQEAAGVPARDVGKGIAAQVALARRESPSRGSRHVGLAQALEEMPQTADSFARGQVSEWRVTLVIRETACLSRQDRATVDAELAAAPGGLAAMGDGAAVRECRRSAYRLDPHAFTRRSAKAESERAVSLRPAPDTMSYLTGLLPVVQGVAVYAALSRQADSLRSEGDDRSRGQIMADTLVERVTGQSVASAVPVEVHLVMTDSALMHDDGAPAHLDGYGPLPAPFARTWLADTDAAVWVRRLYTGPAQRDLIAMDSSRRAFSGLLRRFITIRDQVCRTPWCDGPIRHIDHVVRRADRGDTSAANGQGLCEACNQAKEGFGWHARASGLGTVTPTGHRTEVRSHGHRGPAPRVPSPRASRSSSAIVPWWRDGCTRVRTPRWTDRSPRVVRWPTRRARSSPAPTRP